MKFAPSPEQRDFATSVRELLSAADVPAVTRAWAAGDFAPGRKLWRRLADTGLHALGLPEEHGGFGAHPVDLVMAFEELGRAAVPGPFVESVAVLPALLGGTPGWPTLPEVTSSRRLRSRPECRSRWTPWRPTSSFSSTTRRFAPR
jgi:alkylation response protein AidB-like acyl-CoA dehydrogenase